MLEDYIDDAKRHSQYLTNLLQLYTVILDDWAGIRLVYETEDVVHCNNECSTCHTFLVLGQDNSESDHENLRTTLKESTDKYTTILKNKMLNCKTKSDYQESFILWLLQKCQNVKDFHEELDLIINFKVVFDKNAETNDELFIIEEEMKREILKRAISLSPENNKIVILKYLETKGRNDLINI